MNIMKRHYIPCGCIGLIIFIISITLIASNSHRIFSQANTDPLTFLTTHY